MDIARALADIGIHETEARFYLAALELGDAPMREVAEKAGISRTNAYDVFQRLRQQGLVSEIQGETAKALSVVAAPPTQLLAVFDERRRKVQQLMPDLDSLHVGAQGKPRAVLADFGLALPAETRIRVWDSTAETRFITLPMRPEGTEGWSEEQLAKLVTRDSMIGTGQPKAANEVSP